jgi:hypothetical protein
MNLILKKENKIVSHSQPSDNGLIKNKMRFPKYFYMYVDYARFVHVWWPVGISDLEKSKNTCSEHI